MEFGEVGPPLSLPPPPGRGATPKKRRFRVENRPQNNYNDRQTAEINANLPPHAPPCGATQYGGVFATVAVAVAGNPVFSSSLGEGTPAQAMGPSP